MAATGLWRSKLLDVEAGGTVPALALQHAARLDGKPAPVDAATGRTATVDRSCMMSGHPAPGGVHGGVRRDPGRLSGASSRSRSSTNSR
jgi:hypothetical protein